MTEFPFDPDDFQVVTQGLHEQSFKRLALIALGRIRMEMDRLRDENDDLWMAAPSADVSAPSGVADDAQEQPP